MQLVWPTFQFSLSLTSDLLLYYHIYGCPRTSIEDVPIICPSMFLSNYSWIYRPKSSKMIYYHTLWYLLLTLLKRCRNLGLPDCQIKAEDICMLCPAILFHGIVTYILYLVHDHHNTKIITDNHRFFLSKTL